MILFSFRGPTPAGSCLVPTKAPCRLAQAGLPTFGIPDTERTPNGGPAPLGDGKECPLQAAAPSTDVSPKVLAASVPGFAQPPLGGATAASNMAGLSKDDESPNRAAGVTTTVVVGTAMVDADRKQVAKELGGSLAEENTGGTNLRDAVDAAKRWAVEPDKDKDDLKEGKEDEDQKADGQEDPKGDKKPSGGHAIARGMVGHKS